MRLSEKKVLVIGGSSGMGLAIAAAAVHQDAKVSIAGRSASRLKEAATAIGSATGIHQFGRRNTRQGPGSRTCPSQGQRHFTGNDSQYRGLSGDARTGARADVCQCGRRPAVKTGGAPGRHRFSCHRTYVQQFYDRCGS